MLNIHYSVNLLKRENNEKRVLSCIATSWESWVANKITAFMRYKIWKGREKKRSAKGGIEPLIDRVKKTWHTIYYLHHWSWCFSWLCCASSCTLIDRCLVQSAVSNLFPNQWRCLKLYLPLPVCLICRCVFWLVILFSNLSLCFLTSYNVFGIVVVFS